MSENRLVVRRIILGVVKSLFTLRPLNRRLCWKFPSSRAGGRVALTFDDGPDPRHTPAILAILKSRSCLATFFVLGNRVEAHPEIVKSIAAEGHEIGIHGYDHSFGGLPGQVERCAAILAQRDLKSRLVRPPGGLLKAADWLWLLRHGYVPVLWSFDTGDAMKSQGKRMHEEPDFSDIKDGDIILMHDDNPVCIEELPEVLTVLERKGLMTSSISRLLENG